jgi:UDP-N-acetylglucosamine 4,6-dehydratase/5-epimerase
MYTKKQFKDKVILITGGTGAIGSELVKQLSACEPKQLRVLSRNESRQFELQERLKYPKNLRLLIGDIRDYKSIESAFKKVDIVLHVAAMKQIPYCEYNPLEAIKTNILGSQNVLEACINNKVPNMVAISTDKAVFPSNIMGTSKLMMEKMFLNANWSSGKIVTKFSCARFGNVAWTGGSVLPTWKKQVEETGSVSVTDPSMTRFMMSIEQAVSFVLKATELTRLGEIFVYKMPAISVGELAKIFIEKHYPKKNVQIKITGHRTGDNLHEELIDSNDRASYIFEDKDMYIFTPRFLELDRDNHKEIKNYPGFKQVSSVSRYSSFNCIDPEKIRAIV